VGYSYALQAGYTNLAVKLDGATVAASGAVTMNASHTLTVTATSGGGTYSIAGQVTSGGVGLSGVTLTLSGAASGSVATDASGNYAFTGLGNGTYTVTPSKAGYTFTPSSQSVTVSGANVTGVSFSGTSGATYSISGRVTNGGQGQRSVRITCGTKSVYTDTYGNYTVSGLGNGLYSVRASYGTFTFYPAQATVTVNGANVTGVNFQMGRSVSGRVTLNGAGLSGVTMTLSGAASGSAATDASGNYAFTGLANGTYTVTPSKSGYTFTPWSLSVTLSGANQTGKDFTAAASCTAPAISVQPQSQTIGSGQSATLSVTASGTAPLSYQWYQGVSPSGTAISGATSSTYTTPALTATTSYWVRVSNGCGSVNSQTATITVTQTTQLLLNPGFESGNNGQWTLNVVSGTAHALITAATAWYAPHGGTYQASLCGLNGTYFNSQTDVVKQTVTIPSGATQAALTFWAAVATKETGTVARDFLYVEILTTSGSVLGTPVVLSNLHAGPWQPWTADLLAYKGQTVQIRFRGVTNATYGTVFLLDDTSLAVTVPLRREGGEGAGRKAAAAGPEGALRAEGGGGRVAVAMDGKADSVMEVEAFESAEGEVLLPGREEGRAAEAAGTSVAWAGRPPLGTRPASPGPNAREGDLEEAEGLGDPWGSFENEGRVVYQGSEARKDEVDADPDEGSPADADPDTFEELATSAPAAFSNAVVRYYVTDHLGSPRVVLDAQRQVLDRHDYEPFGVELTPFTDQADLTHRFTGHERDLQTGYDYMHFRFYGSNMGRFLKPDLVVANAADPQSWNLYAYVRNNPIAYYDPYGLWYMSPSNSLRTMDHGLPGPSWDFLSAEAMGPEDDAFFDPNNQALKEISLMESNWEVWSTPMGSSGAWIYHPGTTTTTQTGPITMNGTTYPGSTELTTTAAYWEFTPIRPITTLDMWKKNGNSNRGAYFHRNVYYGVLLRDSFKIFVSHVSFTTFGAMSLGAVGFTFGGPPGGYVGLVSGAWLGAFINYQIWAESCRQEATFMDGELPQQSELSKAWDDMETMPVF
jgi:RHS repeat-associated protein